MLRHRKNGKRGFTLTELLVVLAIGIVLTAFAIPAISNLGLFARDEMRGTARDVLALLQAARVYGATYNVDTAVVYTMDNYVHYDDDGGTNAPGLRAPMIDSDPAAGGAAYRCLIAAAIMYELPAKSGVFQGGFVPAPLEEGLFRAFQGGMVIPLEYSDRFNGIPASEAIPGPLYVNDRPRPVSAGNATALGLSLVNAYPDGYGPLAAGGPNTDQEDNLETFFAHRFTTGGRLVTPDGGKERFTFFVTPPYDTDVAERFDATDGTGKLLGVPLEITRASGRVRIATE